jgi:hypothetical protein
MAADVFVGTEFVGFATTVDFSDLLVEGIWENRIFDIYPNDQESN